MSQILYILWLIGVAIYVRASSLAQGRASAKLFRGETFLLEQKIAGIIFVAGFGISFLATDRYLTYLFIVNAIITFLFYLQPTPRTTKKLLWMFILINAIFLAVVLM